MRNKLGRLKNALLSSYNVALILAVLMVVAFSGCGNKGPLYLPKPEAVEQTEPNESKNTNQKDNETASL